MTDPLPLRRALESQKAAQRAHLAQRRQRLFEVTRQSWRLSATTPAKPEKHAA